MKRIWISIQVYNHAALVASFTAVMIGVFWLPSHTPEKMVSWYSYGVTHAALEAGVRICRQNYTVTSSVSRQRMRAFADAKWQNVGYQLGCSSSTSSPMCYCVKLAFSKHTERMDIEFVDNGTVSNPLGLRAIVNILNTDAISILVADVSTCLKNERSTQYVQVAGGPNVVVPPAIVVVYAWLHTCQFLTPVVTNNWLIIWGVWLPTMAVVYTGIALVEPRTWVGAVLACGCTWFTILCTNRDMLVFLTYGSTLVLLGILADFYTERRDSYLVLLDVFLNAVIAIMVQVAHSIATHYRTMYDRFAGSGVHSRQLTLCWEVGLLLWLCHAGSACIRLVSDGPRMMDNVINDVSFIINFSYNCLCLTPVIMYHPVVQFKIGAAWSCICISVLQSALLSIATSVILMSTLA